jgi:hypothetical protein
MSQGTLVLLGQLEWEDSDFWGKTTKCRRFSIRGQTINGKTDYTLWRRGRDGKVIPMSLGTFDTFEQAVAAAEEAKYDTPKTRRQEFEW